VSQNEVPEGTVGIQIASGYYHGLSLQTDGSIVAWGGNTEGQCNVPDGLVATQVACGGLHSLAIKPDGSVVGWGLNYFGQCDPPDGLVATQIACGYLHSLALTPDGSVVSWGLDQENIGNVPEGLVATQIAGGHLHSLAIKTDGSVVAWGSNDAGQCNVPYGLVATQVSGGELHSLALKPDGSVVSWGSNSTGQVEVPEGLVAIKITCGTRHNLAIKPDGSVVAWGRDIEGQCEVPEGLVATQISAGEMHSQALSDPGGSPAVVRYPKGIVEDLHTTIDSSLELIDGIGSSYVAPTTIGFNPDRYRFESITVSRSVQDMLWSCQGQIDSLDVPESYKTFVISALDHNEVPHVIFSGFVPGKEYSIKISANKSSINGYDSGFYLTRQFLPDGDISYPVSFGWSPMSLIKYWLGHETLSPDSHSKWETVTGIRPYRIHNPTTYGHEYTARDFVFRPTTTKASAIGTLCEDNRMVFLVKDVLINDAIVPCAYFVHEDDIDDLYHGLDLPPIADITSPDKYLADAVKVTEKSDEKYNRIIVRSSTPNGGWLEHIEQTPGVNNGEELAIEYLEERSDLGTIVEVTNRAEDLYDYYTKYSFNYTLTLINRTDLELYQRCRFYGYSYIPEGVVMRIISIQYSIVVGQTNVQITVSPDRRLSDVKRMQKSQTSDSVSNTQAVVQDKLNSDIVGVEVATVDTVDGDSGTVTLERGSTVEVRYVGD